MLTQSVSLRSSLCLTSLKTCLLSVLCRYGEVKGIVAEREVDKGMKSLNARKRVMNMREAWFLVEFQRSFTKNESYNG